MTKSQMKHRDIQSSRQDDWMVRIPAMVHSIGADGRLRSVSDLWLQKLGYERREVLGSRWSDYLTPASRHLAETHAVPKLFETGLCETINYQILCRDGQVLDILVSTVVDLQAPEGPVSLSVLTDISAQRAAERLLIERESRYRLLAEQSMDMVFQLDEHLVWKYASPACLEIAGYHPETLLGKRAFQTLHPDEADQVRHLFGEVAAGRQQHGAFDYRVCHADGRWIWVETRFRSTRDEFTGKPTGLVGTLRDVTAKRELDEKLAEANRRLNVLATQDSLTEIHNRRSFDEIFAREIQIALRLGAVPTLLMIDVDYFKDYNDFYGHPAGDAALRQVSATICTSIRRPTDIPARYGGEEFVVLLPDTDQAQARMIADRIRTSVKALQLQHEKSACGVLTVSIGVATANQSALDSLSQDSLLRWADAALYSAKSKGRDTVAVWTASSAGCGDPIRAGVGSQRPDECRRTSAGPPSMEETGGRETSLSVGAS